MFIIIIVYDQGYMQLKCCGEVQEAAEEDGLEGFGQVIIVNMNATCARMEDSSGMSQVILCSNQFLLRHLYALLQLVILRL